MECSNSILKTVLKNINKNLINNKFSKSCRLLAVSKRRSNEMILNLHNNDNQIDFGENYIQELIEKSKELPKSINWHLIGHCQTNKCKKLLEISNLKTIETVDSLKLASELDNICTRLSRTIDIYIQINISNEETKSGIKIMKEDKTDYTELFNIIEGIIKECKNVKIKGIMSLGNIGNREEFQHMIDIKQSICDKFGFEFDNFVASFGTSDDYEIAVESGSNEVRIGSLLFE